VRHAAGFGLVYGPLVAFLVVGLLVLLLRWTFRHGSSLVAREPRAGAPDEYGLLVAVAAPPSFAEAELLRARLVGRGIRATLAPTTEGPRVLVFPDQAEAARALLRERR
jgi:hypothetical protein